MTKSFIRHYFAILGAMFICVLFTGLMIIFYTYFSLKDTICQNVERNSKVLINDFTSEYINGGDNFDRNILEIHSENLRMDIYIFDSQGNEIISNSFEDEFYPHSEWDFSADFQHEINPVTNICHMEKFSVNFEPYDVYVACVLPYTRISAHTDRAVRALIVVLIITTAVFTVIFWVYKLIKYKFAFDIARNERKNIPCENLNIPVPEKVIPEYQPLVDTVKILQKRLDYREKHMVDFVSNISHELKTPLTVIKGFLGAIIDGTIDSEHRYTYLVKVFNETNRMQQIIKNMLNASSIEAGKITLNIEQFNILDVISEIIFMFERQIEEKHIKIIMIGYPEILVSGDRILLHQVFYNLFENAVKFVDEGGCITLKAGYHSKNVCFYIKNTGNGIPQNDLEHVFDRFFKSDYSRSENPDGAGLGLSIVRRFVNQHHGNISINSEEGKLTELVLTFPQNFAVRQGAVKNERKQ